MHSVQITVGDADLANEFTAMREWLDRERCNPLVFQHFRDERGNLVITANFSEDDQPRAEKFRLHFSRQK